MADITETVTAIRQANRAGASTNYPTVPYEQSELKKAVDKTTPTQKTFPYPNSNSGGGGGGDEGFTRIPPQANVPTEEPKEKITVTQISQGVDTSKLSPEEFAYLSKVNAGGSITQRSIDELRNAEAIYERLYPQQQQRTEPVIEPHQFGGGAVTPTDTSIIGRAEMYYQTTLEQGNQLLRPISYDLLPNNFIKNFAEFSGATSFLSPIGANVIPSIKEQTQFNTGLIEGVLKDIKEEPFKQVIIFGAGEGLGLGLKTGGIAVQNIFGTKALDLVESGLMAGGLGLTTNYAVNVGIELSKQNTPFERGSLIGIETKNLFLFGAGTEIGMTTFEKGIDFYRTYGRTEVPNKIIIAPEYFEGQVFPQIYKGESAGQLRSEFFNPIKEIGETTNLPRGFSASVSKLTNEFGKGGSELYGVYTSPKLSPFFLRIEGERNLFSYDTFGLLRSSRPTANRILFEDIEFPKGVQGSRTRYAITPSEYVDLAKQFGGGTVPKSFVKSIGKTNLDFGEPTLQRGKSFVSFMKSEKESISPFGTKIYSEESKYYFEFKGRKVPIENLKTFEGELSKEMNVPRNKITSLGEYSKELSSSYNIPKTGTGSKINPLSSSISIFSSKVSSPLNSMKSSVASSLSSNKYSLSSTGSSGSSKVSSLFSNISSYTSSELSKGKVPYSSSDIRNIYSPKNNRTNLDFYYPNEFKSKKKKSKKRKSKEDLAYTPSFTAQILGIKGTANKKQLRSRASFIGTGANIREVLKIK